MSDVDNEYVHLVRLALMGQPKDVISIVKRNIRKLNKSHPELANSLKEIIADYGDLSTIQRGNLIHPIPIDTDSKLELLNKEYVDFENDPIWPEQVSRELNAVIEERRHEIELNKVGLSPTRSILFVGPPGVGKTLAAKWLSFQLNRPLFTLDLAAVMSSFLGRTGNNIRTVLNYAQQNPSILLLDEFDAIAKRRNDDSEVGELKRLVTVLLQAVDDWPAKGLLIAATNHPELLDPAVWRRFERVIYFPNPSFIEIKYTIDELLSSEKTLEIENIIEILAIAFEGVSFAEIVRQINNARRESIVKKVEIVNVLRDLIERLCKCLEHTKRKDLAFKLLNLGMSQRRVSEITGVSRDTIRKSINRKQEGSMEEEQVDGAKR